jgi:hypothetical protein
LVSLEDITDSGHTEVTKPALVGDYFYFWVDQLLFKVLPNGGAEITELIIDTQTLIETRTMPREDSFMLT